MKELWMTIVTGFQGHPDNKYVEVTYGDKKVVIPFDVLEKFPLNNTPVFKIGVRVKFKPDELARKLFSLI